MLSTTLYAYYCNFIYCKKETVLSRGLQLGLFWPKQKSKDIFYKIMIRIIIPFTDMDTRDWALIRHCKRPAGLLAPKGKNFVLPHFHRELRLQSSFLFLVSFSFPCSRFPLSFAINKTIAFLSLSAGSPTFCFSISFTGDVVVSDQPLHETYVVRSCSPNTARTSLSELCFLCISLMIRSVKRQKKHIKKKAELINVDFISQQTCWHLTESHWVTP